MKLFDGFCPSCGFKAYNDAVIGNVNNNNVGDMDVFYKKAKERDKYPVNSNAESVVEGVAKFVLVFGIICAIGLTIWEIIDGGEGVLVIVGVGIFCFNLIIWAVIKVIVNISRNLFIVNDKLNKLLEEKK